VVYYSWLDNELLNLRDASGTPLGAFNADETTHFGIELGLSARFSEQLSGRVTYTYQDFRFATDPDGPTTTTTDGQQINTVEAGNRMAGAPRHQINAALRYAFMPNFFVEGEVDWRPDDTPVDNANTLFNEEFVVFNLRANYDLYEQFSIFGEVRNVFDETYASSTLIADDAGGNVNRAAFLPGDGRAFILGVSGKF
jgi:iron complex outermembrane receptor protein